MVERPILIFPTPATTHRHKMTGGPGRPTHRPSPHDQTRRILPQVASVERAFEERRVELRENPFGVEPEKVLVFETVGTVDDFYRALRGMEGLEWLGDVDLDDIPPDGEFHQFDFAAPAGYDHRLRRLSDPN